MVHVVFDLYILPYVGSGVWRSGHSSVSWALSRFLPVVLNKNMKMDMSTKSVLIYQQDCVIKKIRADDIGGMIATTHFMFHCLLTRLETQKLVISAVWVQNLIFHIKGRMQVVTISEHNVRKVLVPKRKEVPEGCRRLQNGIIIYILQQILERTKQGE
jgi:hypothetical protein